MTSQTISQLITQLKRLQEIHGDIKVEIHVGDIARPLKLGVYAAVDVADIWHERVVVS